MLTQNTLKIIRNLIEQSPCPTDPLTGIPTSYAILRHACEQAEIRIEHEKLRTLFSCVSLDKTTLKQAFRKLCHDRYQQNKSTCLSYEVIPQGICNQLYWQIANRLFAPKNLGEMLLILMPEVTHVLHASIQVVPRSHALSHHLQDRVNIHLESTCITDGLAEMNCDANLLHHVVIADHILMPIEPLARLPYVLQLNVRTALSPYPTLRTKLYAHNKSWSGLEQDMQGQHTPKEMLSILIFDLERSGQSFTGREHAGPVAESAVARFQTYLERLPPTIRDQLNQLKTDDGIALNAVLQEYVEYDRCTELTSDRLKSIRNAEAHQALLDQLSQDGATARKNIEAYYNRLSQENGLRTECDITLISALPKALLANALSRVNLKTEEDCLELILYLPPSEYITILEYAKITQTLLSENETLASMMSALRADQRQALMAAFIAKIDKIGDLHSLLKFAIVANDLAVLQQVLNAYAAPTKQMELLATMEDQTLLHLAAAGGNKALVLTLLNIYPARIRFAAMNKKDYSGNTVLHQAAKSGNQALVLALLAFYPESLRLAAVMEKNHNQSTTLHCAANNRNNAETLLVLLEVYPESMRLAAVKEKDSRDNTVLHCAALYGNQSLVMAILSLYPKNKRLAVVKEANKNSSTVLHKAALSGNQSLVMVLLSLYPKRKRLAAVKKEDNNGYTVLHNAAVKGDQSLILALLSFYPERMRLQQALTVRNKHGDNILHIALDNENLSLVLALLKFFPEEMRLAAMTTRGRHDFTILDIALDENLAFLQAILLELPEQDRLKAVSTKDHLGRTMLHKVAAMGTHALLQAILQHYPEEMRLSAIMEKNHYGNTVLHEAGRCHSPIIHTLFSYYPQEKRLAAVTETNKDNCSLLQTVLIQNEDQTLFQSILLELPESDRLAAIKMQDNSGNILLHKIAVTNNLSHMQAILRFYPEEQRLAAMNAQNIDGKTMLHMAATSKNPGFALSLLSLYPENLRLNAVMIKDMANISVLDLAREKQFEKILKDYLRDSLQAYVFRAIYKIISPDSDLLKLNTNDLLETAAHNNPNVPNYDKDLYRIWQMTQKHATSHDQNPKHALRLALMDFKKHFNKETPAAFRKAYKIKTKMKVKKKIRRKPVPSQTGMFSHRTKEERSAVRRPASHIDHFSKP